MGELNIYGIYVPVLFIQAILAYVLFTLLSPLINRLISKGWILFPSLFNFCWYFVLLLITHWIFIFFYA